MPPCWQSGWMWANFEIHSFIRNKDEILIPEPVISRECNESDASRSYGRYSFLSHDPYDLFDVLLSSNIPVTVGIPVFAVLFYLAFVARDGHAFSQTELTISVLVRIGKNLSIGTLSPRLDRYDLSFSLLFFFQGLPGTNHVKNKASKAIRILSDTEYGSIVVVFSFIVSRKS
jgi:hypothetical protein